MINIKVNQSSGNMVIEIKGHANFDKHGRDIVCAGISAIAQSAILGFESIADNYPDHVNIDIKCGQ